MRKHRKTMRATLGPSFFKASKTLYLRANNRFLNNLLHDPVLFRQHIRQYVRRYVYTSHLDVSYSLSAQFILAVTYGFAIKPQEDAIVKEVEETMRSFAAATQFQGLIFDMLPFCE